MDGQKRGHHREGRTEQHDAAIPSANADDRERQGCHRGGESGDADAGEVPLRAQHHHAMAEEVEERRGHDGAGPEQHQERREPVANEEPHRVRIGRADRDVEGRPAYPVWGSVPTDDEGPILDRAI
jgi:hypothetical protein